MAQLVARDVWDVDAAGSNPVTPTKTKQAGLVPACFVFARFHGENLSIPQEWMVLREVDSDSEIL